MIGMIYRVPAEQQVQQLTFFSTVIPKSLGDKSMAFCPAHRTYLNTTMASCQDDLYLIVPCRYENRQIHEGTGECVAQGKRTHGDGRLRSSPLRLRDGRRIPHCHWAVWIIRSCGQQSSVSSQLFFSFDTSFILCILGSTVCRDLTHEMELGKTYGFTRMNPKASEIGYCCGPSAACIVDNNLKFPERNNLACLPQRKDNRKPTPHPLVR